MDIDLDTLKKSYTNDRNLLQELLPNGVMRGAEIVCGNVYGDKGHSFSYNTNTGRWADFATGETGSSILDLIIAQKNITVGEAIRFLKERSGINPYEIIIKEEPRTIELSPVPQGQVPQYIFKDNKSFLISKIWSYIGQDGNTYCFDCRIDYPDGKKDVIPMRWDAEKNRFCMGMLPEPRLLYGIQNIDDFKKIIIVEGCKTAEATKHYFPNWCVVTWQGGSNAVKKADWTVIKDKDVILIPDADNKKNRDGSFIEWKKQCGQKAMLEIASILSEQNNKIRLVNTQSKAIEKDGWDLADAREKGLTQKEVVAFVKENLYEYVSKKEKKEYDNNINVIIEKKYEDDRPLYDDTYFRCMGERGSSTYFLKYASGQLIEFTPSKYDSKHLVSLAPISYWETHFPAKNGVDWLNACDYFSRVQEKIGYFSATNVRGRGCWFDNGHIVLHLGKTLVVDGNPMKLKDFQTRNVYEQRECINVNIEYPMQKEFSRKLIDVCKMARWEEDYYGEILAGWIFASMVCGAMKFRSHLYLIGQSGSGKSWLQDHLIKPILGRMCTKVSSKTSEAGIRALLNNDILPVICDENEVENSKRDKEAMEAIFELARNASSEHSEPIVKSSPTGQVKTYYCRSAFLFSSIKTSMEKVADLNRTAFIRLKNKPSKDSSEEEKINDSKNFEQLREAVEELIDNDYCETLIARAVRLAGVMRETQQIVSDVSAKVYGDRRQGDQMGMVIAGLHALKTDRPLSIIEAEEYLKRFCENKKRIVSDEDEKQERTCMDTLLQMPVKIQARQYPLILLLSFLLGEDTLSEDKFEVERTLSFGGISLRENSLCLSTKQSSLHCTYFNKETMYGKKGWIDELTRCSKKVVQKSIRFTNFMKSDALVIPLYDVFNGEKE